MLVTHTIVAGWDTRKHAHSYKHHLGRQNIFGSSARSQPAQLSIHIAEELRDRVTV